MIHALSNSPASFSKIFSTTIERHHHFSLHTQFLCVRGTIEKSSDCWGRFSFLLGLCKKKNLELFVINFFRIKITPLEKKDESWKTKGHKKTVEISSKANRSKTHLKSSQVTLQLFWVWEEFFSWCFCTRVCYSRFCRPTVVRKKIGRLMQRPKIISKFDGG